MGGTAAGESKEGGDYCRRCTLSSALQLSGIGDKHLLKNGILVVVDLPGVGNSYHMGTLLIYNSMPLIQPAL